MQIRPAHTTPGRWRTDGTIKGLHADGLYYYDSAGGSHLIKDGVDVCKKHDVEMVTWHRRVPNPYVGPKGAMPVLDVSATFCALCHQEAQSDAAKTVAELRERAATEAE